MTARQLGTTTGKILLALLPILLPAMWAFMDARYVHQSSYEKRMTVDSLERAVNGAKLDEVILRLQQIQCGPRIAVGCR